MNIKVKNLYFIHLAVHILATLMIIKTIFQIGYEHSFNYYYIRFALLNILCIALLLYFKTKAIAYLRKVKYWLNLSTFKKERRIIFYFFYFCYFTYFLKLHWGFWWQGIPGWVMSEPSRPEEIDESSITFNPLLSKKYKSFVNDKTLKYWHLNYGTVIKDKVLSLKFCDGVERPANYGIFEVVFPNYVFGTEFSYFRDKKVFLNAFKKKFEQYQKRGSSPYILDKFAYPAHTMYFKIPYEQYPKIDCLEQISIKELSFFINKNRELSVVSEKRIDTIKVK